MSKEVIKKAADTIADNTVKNKTYNNEVCVLTLNGEGGYPYSSVITPAKSDGIKTICFATNAESGKLKCLKKNAKASVCFCSGDYNISLEGDIEIISDPAIKKEMWYDGLEHHHTGADDPTYFVLKFTTKNYNLFFVTGEMAQGTL